MVKEMDIKELNDFTKFVKFSSPFKKNDNFINTPKLSQELPKGRWILTEKIDGTNIRIIITKPNEEGKREIHIGSRKLILNQEDKGSKQYMDCLSEVNTHKIKEYFKDVNSTIIIYGEGYGPGIQKGGIYSKEKNFRVFDIRIGEAYQDFEYVKKVCIDNQLNLVPILQEIKEVCYHDCRYYLNEFKETLIKEGSGGKPEGFVMKFEPVLLNKYKKRLIFKIKFKDFKKEEGIPPTAGSKKDSTGVYSGRVKPKLIELLRWFERKKDIENLIQNKET